MESAEELVSRYGHFEFVFSFYTLHWVRDLAGALANVRRVMRPEGQPSECLLSFLALNPALLVYRILGKNSRWAKYVVSGYREILLSRPVLPKRSVPSVSSSFCLVCQIHERRKRRIERTSEL